MTPSPVSGAAILAGLLVAASAAVGPARASSDEAWKQFSAAVEQKCLAAVKGLVDNPAAIVDPFGSESFGLALVSGTPPKMDQPVSYFCVLDKETGVVELGSELSSDTLAAAVAPKKAD